MKQFLSLTTLALSLCLSLPALADNSGGVASTLQVGKLNKGGPSHSNLSVGQNRVTFQIGNAGVNWSNVTLTVSNGKRVYATEQLATLVGEQSWSWSVPKGINAGTLYVTWKGTITKVSASAAERGINNKGTKGCDVC